MQGSTIATKMSHTVAMVGLVLLDGSNLDMAERVGFDPTLLERCYRLLCFASLHLRK
jgi:hypothetical protein